jgi:hypothetical protein
MALGTRQVDWDFRTSDYHVLTMIQCKLNVREPAFLLLVPVLTFVEVTRFPGAVHRSFASLQQAEDWLMESLDGMRSFLTVLFEIFHD